MTGPEHYREAERHFEAASQYQTEWVADRRVTAPLAASNWHLQAAQVHATLALAAATALPLKGLDGVPGNSWGDWYDVTKSIPRPPQDGAS